MNSIDILKDLAARPKAAAQPLRDVAPDRLNAHPGHDNSIAWLLWHSAREVDEQVSALSGGATVWSDQGFDARFGLDLESHDMGYGHSPDAARAIVVADADLLVEHLEAAIDAQLAYLDTLTDQALADVVDGTFDPPVTRAARLVSVSEDALQHVGQANYLAGMNASAFDA